MASDAMWQKVHPVFTPEELDAPGHPGSGRLLADNTLHALYNARGRVGLPFIIHRNGGVAYTGHSAKSTHYPANGAHAIDFHVAGSMPYQDVLQELQASGFRGIGLYPQWHPKPGFHVDMRPAKLMWVCVGGKYYYFT